MDYDVELREADWSGAYRKGIRANVYALWRGAINNGQFKNNMSVHIGRLLPEAFNEGALRCGITFDEYTLNERLELDSIIQNERQYIPGFAEAIYNGRRGIGLLRDMFDRAELWNSRYADVVGRATVMVCKNKKGEWVYDPAKENCPSCERLNGKVKRMSYWREKGVEPKKPPNEKLECGGWKCGCEIRITTKPMSKGPLPRLP